MFYGRIGDIFCALMMSFLLFPCASAATKSATSGEERFDLRVSGGIFWDYGWGDKFFFKTGRLDDLFSSGMPDWNRTLRHATGPNLELRWRTPLSDNDDLFLSAKYQHLEFSLRDSLVGIISFLTYYKGLDAKLDFVSLGTGIQLEWKPVAPYLGADIGYCIVNLTTRQIFDMNDEGVSNVLVDGIGGGPFFRWSLGASAPIYAKFGVFAEANYLLCTNNWDSIPAEDVQASFNNYDFLTTEDRQIGRIHGLQILFGAQVGF